MLRGIYTAASGMLVQAVQTDVISNNLANVDTPGYHRKSPHVRSFPEILLHREHQGQYTPVGALGTGAVVDGGRFSFQPGRIQATNNPLDAALPEHGFFVVDGGDGPRYTRDGRFSLSEMGWLVQQNGSRVLGEQGPIFIGREGEVEIDSQGDVRVDGVLRDRLLLVEFNEREGLVRRGEGLYEATPEAGDPFRFRGVVLQGALEMPNVNVVKEMVHMIEVHRSYEANQKVVQAYDETLSKAVNEIAG